MKIVRLSAENLKRIKAVEITPDGNTVVIAGRNGQGKTSVLDAIWFALGGGAALKGTARPIRDGAEQASVALDLGDIRVTRTWTEDKTTLRVESAEGARYGSPQQMLDRLVGRMSFDPLAFAQQDEKTQLATLTDLVELPFDPVELDARRRGLYEDRTIVGREVKTLEGNLAGLPDEPDDVPTDEVNASQLWAEYRDAQALQVERDRLVAAHVTAHQRVERARAEFAEAKKQLDALTAELRSAPELPADLAEYDKRLASIEQINRDVRAAQERRQVAATLEAKRGEYQSYTSKIDGLDEQKAAAIRDAQMPIDGLAFDDTGVTYQGIPFKQCSGAEQLRVSLAIAMSMNPQIRVIRITDGSLLDADNLKLIEAMAADRDYQVWIERVDDTGQMGVLIEDGQVVGAAPKLTAVP